MINVETAFTAKTLQDQCATIGFGLTYHPLGSSVIIPPTQDDK